MVCDWKIQLMGCFFFFLIFFRGGGGGEMNQKLPVGWWVSNRKGERKKGIIYVHMVDSKALCTLLTKPSKGHTWALMPIQVLSIGHTLAFS